MLLVVFSLTTEQTPFLFLITKKQGLVDVGGGWVGERREILAMKSVEDVSLPWDIVFASVVLPSERLNPLQYMHVCVVLLRNLSKVLSKCHGSVGRTHAFLTVQSLAH